MRNFTLRRAQFYPERGLKSGSSQPVMDLIKRMAGEPAPAADTTAAPTEEPFVPDQVHFSIVINCNPQPIHPRSTRTRTRMRARAHTHTETALNE